MLTRLPPREPWVPRAADDFVDSIGVTVYGADNAHFATIEQPALERLGVRHVRDWAGLPDQSAAQVAMLRQLAESGIRTHLIFEPRFDILPEHLAQLALSLGAALESVEGPNDNDANEIDLRPADVRQYMRELRAVIDEEGLSEQVALVDSLDLEPEDKGDLSSVLDYGNFERVRDRALPAPDLSEQKAQARLTCGGKPIMVTECGYSTIESETSVPEGVAAKYILRLLLGHFDQNIARTYLDELIDGPETDTVAFMAQGLLHIDGREKPAFGALQRLIALLEDPGEPFELAPLDIQLGDTSADLRSLLLQQRDGRYALVLWQEVESFDAARGAEREVGPRAVRVQLATPPRALAVHEPLHDDAPVMEASALNDFDVQVADHPVIVLIEP